MRNLFSICFISLYCSTLSFSQFHFHVDTVFFQNEYVSKVSVAENGEVWVIKDSSQREIGKVDTSAQQHDLSSSFQSSTSSTFTDILVSLVVGSMSKQIYISFAVVFSYGILY